MVVLRLQAGMEGFARRSSGAASRHDAGSDEGGRGAGKSPNTDAAADGGGGEKKEDGVQGKRRRPHLERRVTCRRGACVVRTQVGVREVHMV